MNSYVKLTLPILTMEILTLPFIL